MRTRTLVPYAAYLRAYEPLAAFPDDEQARWRSFVADADHPTRHEVLAREQVAALVRAAATPPLVAPAQDSGDAYVIMAAGSVLICPVEDQLRCWLALGELRASLPDQVAEVLVPPGVSGQAELDFAVWQADRPVRAPRILTATWHVPPRWFVPFVADERLLALGPGMRSLVYRAPMASARRRVARTMRVLRHAEVDSSVAAAIDDLGRWLEEFDPHGYVELDYGGLVHCVGDDELRSDASPADVAAAVAALADGDAVSATLAYRRVVHRWERVRAREHAN